VYLRNISINTLHKGDDDDDDDDDDNSILTIEIQHMWNVKTNVISVIIGVTETISKSFTKYLSNVPGNHEVKKLQKTAILGTAHIFQTVELQVKFTLKPAVKAQKGSGGIAPLFL
jgi:hypothetical protein